MWQRVQVMIMRYIKTYPYLWSLVMYGNTFKMTEIALTKGHGNFPKMATYPIHVCRV